MRLHNRFLRSLFSAKSISNFRLLGVGSTIIYVLSLTFVCILPVLFLFIFNLFNTNNQPLDNFQNYGLNPEQMQDFAASINGVLPIIFIVIYMAMYILFSGLLFSGVSVLSGIGLSVSKVINKNLTYRHLWVMSCYSITLPMILLTFAFIVNVNIPYSFFLFWVISFIILAAAIYKSPEKK
jgi:Protein of unknown function (DUF1189)